MENNVLKTVNIKGKDYVEVNQRIKAFRSMPEFKGFSLESEIVTVDDTSCVIKAVIRNAEGRVVATGFAQEDKSSSMINKTSYVENCETSAWGRALGNLGIGIDATICSAEEVSMAIAKQEMINKPQAKQTAPKKAATKPQPAPVEQPQQTMPCIPENIVEGWINSFSWLDPTRLNACGALNIDIERVAAYNKVSINQLTNEMLSSAVAMKTAAMQKAGVR